MAGSIVSAASGNSPSSDNAPTVTKPAGVGVVYVFSVVCNNQTLTITWPAGFTEIAESGNETTIGCRIRTAVREYTGTEGATFAATMSGYAPWFATCVLLDGITATLVDSDSTGNYTGFGSVADLTGGSVSTGGSDRFVLWVGASMPVGATSPTSYTPPSSFTLYGSVYVPYSDSAFMGHWTKSEPTSVSGGYSGSATYSGSETRNGFTSTLVFAEVAGAAPPLIAWVSA